MKIFGPNLHIFNRVKKLKSFANYYNYNGKKYSSYVQYRLLNSYKHSQEYRISVLLNR